MIRLIKNTLITGKNKIFLRADGFPLTFGDVPEFLTENFIYDLRKQAMTCVCPIDLIWYIIDFIEKYGNLQRGQSKENNRLLNIAVANIFCSAFGVDIVQAKFVKDAPVYCEWFEKCEGWFKDDLQACLDLYRDEWGALIKEYEMEHGES